MKNHNTPAPNLVIAASMGVIWLRFDGHSYRDVTVEGHAPGWEVCCECNTDVLDAPLCIVCRVVRRELAKLTAVTVEAVASSGAVDSGSDRCQYASSLHLSEVPFDDWPEDEDPWLDDEE